MRLRLRSSNKGMEEKIEGLETKDMGEKVQEDSSVQGSESGWQYEGEEGSGRAKRDLSRMRRTLLLILRDVVLAIIIVVVILLAIIAYTRVWPPMVVIESSSMQHDDYISFIGVIDTGDLVLVQAAAQRSDVVTWVEGKARGYTTYSNYGDVIIFDSGDGGTPIIHRPIIWLEYNNTINKFNAPDLEQLDRSQWGGTYLNNSPVDRPYGLDHQLRLNNAGWNGDFQLTIDIKRFLDDGVNYSGYLTLGDHNSANYDRTLVRQENIIGKARGELPWLGLIKLTVNPSSGKCCKGWGDPSAPKNSWDALIVAIVLMITLPILTDILGSLVSRFIKKRGEGQVEAEEGSEKEPPEKDPEQGTEGPGSQDNAANEEAAMQDHQENNKGPG